MRNVRRHILKKKNWNSLNLPQKKITASYANVTFSAIFNISSVDSIKNDKNKIIQATWFQTPAWILENREL